MVSLILKLLFKASVPLFLVLGVASYAVHLRGGEPGAVLGHVGTGVAERLAGAGRDARDGAGRAAGTLTDAVTGATARVRGDDDGMTEVSTWVDASGRLHYSNAGDAPAGARLMRIDPNANVLAPLPAAAASPRPPAAEIGAERAQALQRALQPR